MVERFITSVCKFKSSVWAGPVWSDCFVQSVLSGICQYLKIIFGVIWLNLNYRARHRAHILINSPFLGKKRPSWKKNVCWPNVCLYLHLKIMTDTDWIMWASCWRFQEEEDVNTFFMILKVLLLKEQTIVVALLTVRGPESTRSWTRDPWRVACWYPSIIPKFYCNHCTRIILSIYNDLSVCLARIKFPAI